MNTTNTTSKNKNKNNQLSLVKVKKTPSLLRFNIDGSFDIEYGYSDRGRGGPLAIEENGERTSQSLMGLNELETQERANEEAKRVILCRNCPLCRLRFASATKKTRRKIRNIASTFGSSPLILQPLYPPPPPPGSVVENNAATTSSSFVNKNDTSSLSSTSDVAIYPYQHVTCSIHKNTKLIMRNNIYEYVDYDDGDRADAASSNAASSSGLNNNYHHHRHHHHCHHDSRSTFTSANSKLDEEEDDDNKPNRSSLKRSIPIFFNDTNDDDDYDGKNARPLSASAVLVQTVSHLNESSNIYYHGYRDEDNGGQAAEHNSQQTKRLKKLNFNEQYHYIQVQEERSGTSPGQAESSFYESFESLHLLINEFTSSSSSTTQGKPKMMDDEATEAASAAKDEKISRYLNEEDNYRGDDQNMATIKTHLR